jgi:hypothetical protein
MATLRGRGVRELLGQRRGVRRDMEAQLFDLAGESPNTCLGIAAAGEVVGAELAASTGLDFEPSRNSRR